ncbi:hypothetical protein NEUTE2DRAFT_76106 [Neurospora tetrasperma FGSC 2509]|nr:hypothetical protein NEUTE2DRAFT_76106 [Neurospora tetrasperma FGSC 2509]
MASRGGGGGGGGLVVAVGGGCGEVQSYSSCHVQKKKTGWGNLAERKIGISGEAPPPHDPIHGTQPWEEDPVLLSRMFPLEVWTDNILMSRLHKVNP